MSIESSNVRNLIKPQDAVTILITLLGIAIALFLSDAIIKLIGGSIALLAGVALYITIAQRMSDQVQLKTRRTTLPPPSFKTRVTTDPGTSTRRIVFDDYQQAFNPADDDVADAWGADEGEFATVASRAGGSDAARSGGGRTLTEEPPTLRRPAVAERAIDDDDEILSASPGESFRVLKPQTGGTASAEAAPADPVAAQVQETLEAVGRNEPPQSGKRRIDVKPTIAATLELPDLPEAAPTTNAGSAPSPTPIEPVTVSGPVEEVRHEHVTSRRQAQMVLQDLIADSDEEVKGGEPRAEFVRLVGQVLNAVARSIQARSIIFCWVNLEKQHVIPEARLTTGNYDIRTGARIPLGSDIVSQIARSGIPEIITDISPAAERELIPYYSAPANTRSFIGVPVFFRREVVGVLVADSNEVEAFDEGSVATLAEYTRLISGLIRGYTEKYDLQLIARTLDTFESMHRGMTGRPLAPDQIAGVLASNVSQLFDSLYVAVVLFDDASREWRIAAATSQTLDGQLAGIQPDMSGSLVGRCTRFAEEIYLDHIGQEARFSPDEPFAEGGAFLALPLVATTKCYGALAIEHPVAGAYIPRDIDLLRDLVRYAAMAIEVYNVNRAIETQIVLDESTGLYNSGFLLSTLEHEVLRARDFKTRLSFALITIDMPPSARSERSGESQEEVAASVGAIIGSTLRPYDTLGRYDAGTFGVILAGKSDQDAYLWAERLRKEVASSVLNFGPRKISVTISVGISEQSELTSGESIVDGARQALEKAAGGQGNAVILY
jgi:diguanylate cyclase (GGDEF)-like protein